MGDIPWIGPNAGLWPALLFDGILFFKLNTGMNNAELNVSRRKHLTQSTKGHFWTQERRHAPEVMQGEGRIYETSFTQLLTYLRGLEVPNEKRERLEKLLRQLEESAFNYVTTRVEFSRASQ